MIDKFKTFAAVIVAVLLLLTIAFYVNKMSAPQTADYNVVGQDTQVQTNSEITQTQTDSGKVLNVEEGKPFTARAISGGGENPGWLLSISETQPKVFTGKLLANEGVETYSLFVQEESDFFAGEAKDIKDASKVKTITIQKSAGECKDSEGTNYEFNLSINFDGKTMNGCGGKVISSN